MTYYDFFDLFQRVFLDNVHVYYSINLLVDIGGQIRQNCAVFLVIVSEDVHNTQLI